MTPPAPFFLLKIALAVWNIFCFHTNCEIFCSSSVKKCHWYFDSDCIESVGYFGWYNHFHNTILQIQEHALSLYLFMWSLISFFFNHCLTVLCIEVFCLFLLCCAATSVTSSFATLWTVAHQTLLSVGFSRQEYLSGLPYHPLWDFPGNSIWVGCHNFLYGILLTQGSNPHLLCLLHWKAGSLPLVPPGKHLVFLGRFIPRYFILFCCNGQWDRFLNLSFWFFHCSYVGMQGISVY